MVTVSEFKALLQKNMNELIWRNRGWGPIPIHGKGGEKGYTVQDRLDYHTQKRDDIKDKFHSVIQQQDKLTMSINALKEAEKAGHISKENAQYSLTKFTKELEASQKYSDRLKEQGALHAKMMYVLDNIVGKRLHTVGMKNYNTVKSNLTPSEITALSKYKSLTYKSINGQCRGKKKDPIIDEYIQNIDSALSKTLLSKEMTLYRGIRSDLKSGALPKSVQAIISNPEIAKGKIISDKAFTSTSLSKKYSRDWAEVAEKKVYMTIKAPAGSQGLYMDIHHDTGGEFEMLLPRNSKFRIKEVRTTATGITELDVDLVK